MSTTKYTRAWLRGLAALGAALLLLQLIRPAAAPLASAQAAAGFRTYLPLVRGASGRQTEPPPPAEAKGALFLSRAVKQASADAVVDGRGGMHAAYVHFTPTAERLPAVYLYCPGPAAACASPAGWQAAQLGGRAIEAQLALTPAGAPRMLIVAESTVFAGGKDYVYAACDQGCGQAGQWRLTRLLTGDGTTAQDVNDQRMPQRTFALDPQGRPRFIYQDRNYLHAEPDHIGAYYAWCDEGCDDAANWYETRIGRAIEQQFRRDFEIFDYASLTFTAAGQPRVVARVFAFNEDGSDAPDGLYYLGCDSACDDHASWQRVFLLATGSGSYPHPSWDLALGAAGQPRIALFTGGGLQPDTVNYQLLYLWCDQGCLDAAQWSFNTVGLGRSAGQSADLELDARGLPRLAWIDAAGDLGYAWCDVGCESEQPQWRRQVVETEAQLRREQPQAIPPHCDNDVWEGLAPSLSLEPGGSPRIAYDVSVNARCYYDTTPGDPSDPPTIKFEPVWHGARLAFFPQP